MVHVYLSVDHFKNGFWSVSDVGWWGKILQCFDESEVGYGTAIIDSWDFIGATHVLAIVIVSSLYRRWRLIVLY